MVCALGTVWPLAAQTLSVHFEKEPVEHGLSVVRREASGVTLVTTARGDTAAWRASHGSAPGVPWGRSVFFRVTDSRFREGRMPAVDIEIVYRSTAWAPVELWADTAAGARVVGSGWGNSPEWQTLRVELDDAFFGSRSFGHPPERMACDGFDLRVNGYNEDLDIRSITVRGYDLDSRPDYRRLLRLIAMDHPEEIFLFSPGDNQTLTYRFRNVARRAVAVNAQFRLTDWSGQVLHADRREASIPGSAVGEIPFRFPTAGLPLGVYRVELDLTHEARSLMRRESYVGLTAPGRLAKARAGEFLYGLDVVLGEPQRDERLMGWINAMGVDIVRNGGIQWSNPEHVRQNLPLWERHGIQVLAMVDVPWHEDAAVRRQQTAALAQQVEAVARECGPRVTWWELGNEPDLTFFYKGPIEAYAEGFAELSRAIQRGDPTDIVANGGLCFAGAEATARARRFMEIVDPTALGAIAYHGHGPGATAEKAALDRIRQVAREFGKDAGRPFIETESGMAARTMAQEVVQAHTCVQKMVFAQAEGLPMLMWFRLLMPEEGYGSLRTDQEPRPVVLAFREMVRQLRGLRHAATLELGAEVDGYLFVESNGRRRAIVLWSNAGRQPRALQLTASDSKPVTAELVDLFGNRQPVAVAANGTCLVEATPAPQYLVWEATDPGFQPRAAPALLSAAPALTVAAGSEQRLQVVVTNPVSRTLAATLHARAAGEATTVEPISAAVELSSGSSTTVTFRVTVGGTGQAIQWPLLWQTYVHVRRDVDLGGLQPFPAELPGVTGPVKAVTALALRHRLDFEALGGRLREGEAAVAVARVWSPAATTVTVGASADWWMAWYVNGQPVYDTLATGNGGGYSITDHTFPVALQAGWNWIAVKVLSGSMGWKLYAAGPADVAAIRQPERVPRVELELVSEGMVMERRVSVVRVQPPVQDLPAGFDWAGDWNNWETLPPSFVLDEMAVENFFVTQPLPERWWQGPGDLSGYGWVYRCGDDAVVVVCVRDDRHRPETDEVRVEFLTGDRPVPAQKPVTESGRDEERRLTWYRVRLPRPATSTDLVLRVTVVDGDEDDLRKQQVVSQMPVTLW